MGKGLVVTLTLTLVSVLSLATWAADEAGYAGHGTVKSVDESAGTVTIDHGDIPGLMMGMMMTFSVSDADLLGGVGPGQVVDFRVRKNGDRYLVTDVRPAAADDNPGRHGMTMNGNGGCCGATMNSCGAS